MSSGLTNEKGQGASHATQSSVPGKVQDKAPKSVEDKLPDAVHDTGSNPHTGKSQPNFQQVFLQIACYVS